MGTDGYVEFVDRKELSADASGAHAAIQPVAVEDSLPLPAATAAIDETADIRTSTCGRRTR
jgi:hypothetical protein